MSRPKQINRYVVYHSSFGECYCNTLIEARSIVRHVESHSSYCPSIYDTKKGIHLL